MVQNGTEDGAAAAVISKVPAKPLNDLFSHLPTTIFEVMSKLAMEHSSVNLGQGFPGMKAGGARTNCR